ncbi:hypothetical protein B0H13DRAFT_2362364 [Mycena leptocephala]|nr:hypothetical protein B0H13DRAFT_2362364 [Mycena leptocephala]
MVRDAPDTHRSLFLVTFYANLDPGDIPTGRALDAILLTGSAHGTAIERVVISITALRYVPTPPPAAQSDIWLRSWRWLNSLHEHSPPMGGDTAGLCRICDSLAHDVDNGDGRVAWRQELARGLGGDLAALAPIFVHHLDLAAGNARFKLPVSTTRMSLVVTLVDFLVDTSVTTGLDEQYQEALMTHGNLRHLTAAICGLALNGKLKLGRCFGLLAQRLWATAAHSLFAESFQGGLLREIMLLLMKLSTSS